MRKILFGIFFWTIICPGDTLCDENTNRDSVGIGLVLSAGGALGLAHIGVLKVLDREGINVSSISANSMGAIIGSLYAAGYSATQIESTALGINWKEMIVFSLPSGVNQHPGTRQRMGYLISLEHNRFRLVVPSAVANLQSVEFFLHRHLARAEYDASGDYNRLAIPFRVIAVDINSGRKITFSNGSLVKAIRGSIAIPGVFSPSMVTSMRLVDGGVMQYLPVEPVKELNPDIIIGSLTVQPDRESGSSVVDVISRTTSMLGISDITEQRKECAVLIEPDLSQFDAINYERVKDFIAAGEHAAEKSLSDIRRILDGRITKKKTEPAMHRPLPVVSDISFTGMRILSPVKFNRLLKTRKGEILDFDLFIRDLVNLYQTSLFDHVDYRLIESGADSVGIVIEVSERNFGDYLFGLRYDNYDNATLGLEIGIDNIKGSSIGARGIATLGDPNEYRLRIEYLNPQYTRFFGHLDPYWSSIDRSYFLDTVWIDDYNIDNRGALVEVCCNLGYDTYAAFGFNAHQSLYRFPLTNPFGSIPSQEWVSGPTVSVERNDEAGYNLATQNDFVHLSLQYGSPVFYSRTQYVRVSLVTDGTVPLSSRVSASGTVNAGISRGDLPWSEHFYTGGSSFVGYKAEYLTSRQKLTATVGLNYRLLGSAKSRSFALYLRLLCSGGFVSNITDITSVHDVPFSQIIQGFGAGIWIDTPAGPVQLIAGITHPTLNRGVGYQTAAIYFSIGRDFRYTR